MLTQTQLGHGGRPASIMDDMFGLLHSKLDPARKLLTVISCNMIETLYQLIELGVNVDTPLQQQNGNAALHVACEKGHYGCVRVLLDAMANPDVQNNFGFTPLAVALRNGQAKCVELLFSSGSVLSDPQIIWSSQTISGEQIWYNYDADMIELLLIATPSLRGCGDDMCREIYFTHVWRSESPALIKTFFLSGNSLLMFNTRALLSHVEDEMKCWLASFRKLHSLQHYARLAIRKQLRPNAIFGAKMLPLPTPMRDYLVFKSLV